MNWKIRLKGRQFFQFQFPYWFSDSIKFSRFSLKFLSQLLRTIVATGAVYDVECRDSKTGDGAFLAVSPPIAGGSLSDVKDQVLIKSLFGPRGRFSFYGQPTDIKVKKSTMGEDGSYKVLDVSFSTLSQATQTEVPRRSKIVAYLPKGSKQAVMLVGSSSASRWSKGADKSIGDAVGSFRATAAPQTNLKLRAVSKDRDEFGL